MWVLIVNSGHNRSGIDFRAFVELVKSSFSSLSCHDVKFMVKRANHLRPWLFEEGTQYSDPVAVTRFDRLDFVFLYGDPALLPWMRGADQLRVLLRMCYNTGKATFCCGFGGQLLAYVASTGGRELTVVNGGGKGGDLSTITTCPTPQLDERDPLVTTTSVFLDHHTGDAFRYDQSRDVWAPFANVGLSRQDLTAQRTTYRPGATHKLVEQVYTARRHHVACRIGTASLHHWACSGVGREFVVPVWGRWKLALQSIRVRVPSFAVLGEAPTWGPVMFEVSNLLGCLFDITPKHKQTCRILSNFIQHKYKLMQQFEHIDNSSAMLLPTHPRDPKGNPIVPHLAFGPDSTVRTQGEALQTPRDKAETPRPPPPPSQQPAFNTYHSTRLRLTRSSLSQRRPTSATVRTRYSPASPRASQRGAGGTRRHRPASARPVLNPASAASSNERMRATFTGGMRRHGEPVGRAGTTATSPRPESARSLSGKARGDNNRKPGFRPGRRRPASASAHLMSNRGPRHDFTPRAVVPIAGATSRREYRPRRDSGDSSNNRQGGAIPRPRSWHPGNQRTAPGGQATTTPSHAQRGVTWSGATRGRKYHPANDRDHHHDHPQSAAAAAAARRGASISPRDATNPHSPRGHTAAHLAEYAFTHGQPVQPPATRGDTSSTRGSVDDGSADGGSNDARPPRPPPGPKRVIIKPKKKRFSSWRKFKRLEERDAQKGTRFVSVRSDGTPWMSGYEARAKEYRESKKKWIGGRFCATFGRATTNNGERVKLITAQSTYYPPKLHKFRDEDRTRFVGGQFKLA